MYSTPDYLYYVVPVSHILTFALQLECQLSQTNQIVEQFEIQWNPS